MGEIAGSMRVQNCYRVKNNREVRNDRAGNTSLAKHSEIVPTPSQHALPSIEQTLAKDIS